MVCVQLLDLLPHLGQEPVERDDGLGRQRGTRCRGFGDAAAGRNWSERSLRSEDVL